MNIVSVQVVHFFTLIPTTLPEESFLWSAKPPFLLPVTLELSILYLMTGQHDNVKIIARNRKAMRNYQISDRLEAGIELLGCEVKSLREGRLNLGDAYAIVKDGEVFLRNLHISPYEMISDEPPDPLRPRRLLLHRREIRRLKTKTEQRGMTLVPLLIYFKGKIAKVELGLGVGRKKYDKRDLISKADADRRMKQAMRKDHKD